jgi:GNAT superfamily N-acetyltransferase
MNFDRANLALHTQLASAVDSFRVAQLSGMFDLPWTERLSTVVSFQSPPLDSAWKIAAIVGPSGTGKTSVAKKLFGNAAFRQRDIARWPYDRAIVDAFPPMPIKRLLRLLAAVGLNSPPAWLKPFRVLSCGEQFRANLALRIALALDGGEKLPVIVVDEFTSTVDRLTARSAATALAKAIRSDVFRLRLVAVTCHSDVLPWLTPDWTLDMTSGDVLLKRPRPAAPIAWQIQKESQSAWVTFAKHHYLSGELPRGATCYVASWKGRALAFCATVGIWGRPGQKRISRLVVVPEAQGLGIGMQLAEEVCRREAAAGFRCSIRASHPAVLAHCRASELWQATGIHRVGTASKQQRWGKRIRTSDDRLTATFVFVPRVLAPAPQIDS